MANAKDNRETHGITICYEHYSEKTFWKHALITGATIAMLRRSFSRYL
jgi:hypothetical protein